MKTLLVLAFMFLSIPAFASEVVTDFTENSVPVLNEELRQKQESINAVEDRATTLEAADVTLQASIDSHTHPYTTSTDSSTSDETTTSATYVDTTLSITFTPGKAGIAFFHFSATDNGGGGTGTTTYAIVLDSTAKPEASTQEGTGNSVFPINLTHSENLTAAAHTVKVQFKITGGATATMMGATTTCRLTVSYLT